MSSATDEKEASTSNEESFLSQSVDISVAERPLLEQDEHKHDDNAEAAKGAHTASAELRKRRKDVPPLQLPEQPEGEMYGGNYHPPPQHADAEAPPPEMLDHRHLQQPYRVGWYRDGPGADDENCCRWRVAAQKCLGGGKVLAVTLGVVAFALVIYVLASTQSNIRKTTETMADYSSDLSQNRAKWIGIIDRSMNLVDAATGDQEGGTGTPFSEQVRSARQEFGHMMDELRDVAQTIKGVDLAAAIKDAAAGAGVFKKIMDSINESGRLHIILQLEK